MKPLYEREDLKLTEFEAEDIITTSGISPQPSYSKQDWENKYVGANELFDVPGTWF